MKKKITITIAILASALLLAAGWLWLWSRNLIEIENESGKMAKVVTVTVCGKTYRAEGLPSGDTRRMSFDVTGDSGFQIHVSFDDGSEVAENFGYVTGGAGAYSNRAKIKIRSDSIDGTQEH